MIYLSFYDYCLIDFEEQKKQQTTVASGQSKTENTKGATGYTTKESPTQMKATTQYSTKSGMLIQNHS